jgi:hypothetical protein
MCAARPEPLGVKRLATSRVAVVDLTGAISLADGLTHAIRLGTDPVVNASLAAGLADDLRRLRNGGPVDLEDDPNPTRYRLDELLRQPELLKAPEAVVPRLAWKSRSTLFASREKRGKSTLLGYAAAQASHGRSILGRPCSPQTVLVIGLEEFIGDLARRLQKFDAHPERVHVVASLVSSAAARLGEIREHVIETGATLVIVDTLMAYVSGGVSDTSSAAQMEPYVQGLTRLARDTEAGVVIVGHGKKSDGEYRDSSSIGAAVDVIASMKDEAGDDDTLRTVTVRGRVPTADFQFRFDGNEFRLVSASDVSPAEDISTALGKVTAQQADLAQKITDILAKTPGASAKAVRLASQARAADTDRMIARLLEAGTITNCGTEHRHRYYLPSNAPLTLEQNCEGRPAGTTSGRPSGRPLSGKGSPSGTTLGRGADEVGTTLGTTNADLQVPMSSPPIGGATGRRTHHTTQNGAHDDDVF